MKKHGFIVITLFITALVFNINYPKNNNLSKTLLLNNVEALASSGDLYSKDYFTKYETLTQTRKDDSESIDEKYVVDCTPGGITPQCEKKCQTRRTGLNPTEWKECGPSDLPTSL